MKQGTDCILSGALLTLIFTLLLSNECVGATFKIHRCSGIFDLILVKKCISIEPWIFVTSRLCRDFKHSIISSSFLIQHSFVGVHYLCHYITVIVCRCLSLLELM